MMPALSRLARAAVLASIFQAAVLADATGSLSLPVDVAFDLDTDSTVNSGGDFVITGTSNVVQGNATIYSAFPGGNSNSGGAGTTYQEITLANLKAVFASGAFTGNPISASSLLNAVFAVYTNGGNFAKVWITQVDSTNSNFSITYDTFGANGGGTPPPSGGPAITLVQNNYSLLIPAQPNYGIAPGALILITGTNLADATSGPTLTQSSAAPGLPATLNGSSVAVIVKGVTTRPALYYATPTQLAVVLPSATPTGNGMLVVTHGIMAPAFAPILVVPSALGLASLYGNGTGMALATDNLSGALFGYLNSAGPGQAIDLWGSGLGADLSDSDTMFTAIPHASNVSLQIYIGGVPATVAYRGGSGYPGVNQIAVIVPKNVLFGCAVSVVAVSGGVVSNTVTMPVAAQAGMACSDPAIGINGSTMQALGSKATYNSGVISISQMTSSGTTTSTAIANFAPYPVARIASAYGMVSIGSCIVSQAPTLFMGASFQGPLDAGTLKVIGTAGAEPLPVVLNGSVTDTGSYSQQLPGGFVPSSGGTFVVVGNGGTNPMFGDVGAFEAGVNVGAALTWTNMNAFTSVTRSQGLPIVWSGGDQNSFVVVSGISGTPQDSVSFTCYGPISAGEFIVPSYVLQALPAGGGSITVQNQSTNQSFTAAGLDYGIGFGSIGFTISNLPFE